MTACPSCSVTVGASEQFCEACGAELTPADAEAVSPPAGGPAVAAPVPIDLSGTVTTCQTCGGTASSDGYCDTCGARVTKHRDHFSEQPAAWVAAVCDRGIRHTRNEDAMALAADPEPGTRAVLVVCDGVSSSLDSDLASLAAARAARDVLASSRSRGMGDRPSLVAAVITRLERAADAASEAVVEVTRRAQEASTVGGPAGGSPAAAGTAQTSPAAGTAQTSPASCTFVAAVVERDLLVVGSVGDSRGYWLPDIGPAIVLTVDDSFAQMQIDSGVPRAEAETGPQSHAITRWLGSDAPDHTPTTASMRLADPGWLLVCSDGLWNYCSAPEDLAALVRQTGSSIPAATDPLVLAGSLVDWANAQGGQDNITVAVARIQPGAAAADPTPSTP